MYAAQKPFGPTFTLQVLCSTSPIAVGTIQYSKTIFDFKLFELDVNLTIASLA